MTALGCSSTARAHQCDGIGEVSVAFHLALVNHSCARNAIVNAEWGNTGRMAIVTLRDIVPGEEVCISYKEVRQMRN